MRQGKADYSRCSRRDYVVLYVGTGRSRERRACRDPEFDKIPKQVKFKLGFKSPRLRELPEPGRRSAKRSGWTSTSGASS